MKILVAVDYGLYGEAQIKFMTRCFTEQKNEIIVLHVVEPVIWELQANYLAVMPLSDAIIKDRRDSAEKLIIEVAEKLRAVCTSSSVSGVIREGSVSNEIIAAASDENADLLIVGSHGRTGLEKFLLGSVSQAICSHASCSVLIARR